MALVAYAVPIQPGKTEQWKRMVGEINGPRRKEFEDAHQREHVRQRVFLQSAAQGDMVVVTLEGDDPIGSFRRLMSSRDPFTRWFTQQVNEIHGIDVIQMINQPLPQLWVDSEPGAARQRKAA